MSTLFQEIINSISVVSNDKTVRAVAIILSIFCTLLYIFISYLTAVFVFGSYILGFVVAWLLIKYYNKTNLYVQQLANIYRDHLQAKKRVTNSCSICEDLSCRRHQKSKSITPWRHLHVNKTLNSAIEHFYEKIIEHFINSWYKQFTDDQDFPNELRYCLRYSTALVINRFLELDIGQIISKNVLPCVMKHIDDYLYIQQIRKLKNAKINDVILEYLGKRLHAAATNRKNELSYLQFLISSILNHILPEDYLKCRNYTVVIREILAGWVFLPLMDVVADPNIINYLVILSLTYKPKKGTRDNVNEGSVEFLLHFGSSDSKKRSSFATNLNKIKNNTNLLYAFMQFLKKQDLVNLLQFCLDVDDFNVKLLTPDLSKKQVEELHSDALKIYKEYLDKDSYNFISCPPDILNEFDNLMKEYYGIEKLTRSSKLLYNAYDHTFTELETVWLPKFFHSSEFYGDICGSRIIPTYNKQLPGSRQKKFDSPTQGAVSKLSSGLGKIRGVLRPNHPVDGALFPGEPQYGDTAADDMLLTDCNPLFRDLSTWRVFISTFQVSANKIIHFMVNVERTDVPADDSRRNWYVWRKDQDFYTLKAKLVEFHGENEICDSPLPSRKAGSFVEARMAKYEEFLKKLLRKSTLRGSDLLYAFLTIEDDFSLYITTNASNIQDFGNIYQSMAYKLRKEKGQHLDCFMDAFLKSTGAPKNEKPEWNEIGEGLDPLNPNYSTKSTWPKTYRNHIFNDNFGIHHKSLKETMSGSFNPENFTECFFYLLRYVFNIPNGLLKLYAAVCSIAGHLVDTIFKIVVELKLKQALCQSNLTYLIKQLEGVIFTPHISPTKEELEKRRMKAFELLDEAFPTLLTKILGSKSKKGMSTILEILQHPHYNKQLAYNLLDIIVNEMYPTLNTKEEHYSLT